MAFQRHHDEGLQRQAEPGRVQHRGVAGDDPGILQPLHPALAGGGGKPDLLGQRHHGQAAVALQGAQDAAVDGIEVDGGFRHGNGLRLGDIRQI